MFCKVIVIKDTYLDYWIYVNFALINKLAILLRIIMLLMSTLLRTFAGLLKNLLCLPCGEGIVAD